MLSSPSFFSLDLKCHTCFTASSQPVSGALFYFIFLLRNDLECCALCCQHAGYVRDTVSVMQHAHLVVFYIQEQQTTVAAALFMDNSKGKKGTIIQVKDAKYIHHLRIRGYSKHTLNMRSHIRRHILTFLCM